MGEVTRLYRKDAIGRRSWLAIDGATDDLLDERLDASSWRPATRAEFVRWYLTHPRFSWLTLAAASALAGVVRWGLGL